VLTEAIALRICRTAHAKHEPGFRASGIYRFDAPDQSFGTCYAARDFQTCFFETVVRDGGLTIAKTEYDSRSVVVLLLDLSKLHLVELHGLGAKKLAVNLADIAGADYAYPQALSRAVYSHPSAPHGIVYRSRFDDAALAVVLFDRALPHVRLFPKSKPTPLRDVPELGEALRSVVGFDLV
jgi:hypothetical protein